MDLRWLWNLIRKNLRIGERNVWMTFITVLLKVLLCVNLQEVNFMAMEASKGDILAGFQKLFGNIFIPALQKQEVIVFY